LPPIGGWRRAVLDVLHVVWLTTPSLVLSLVAMVVIARPDQSLEAARVLAEQARLGDWQGLVIFLALATAASLVSWYWARVAIYVFEIADRKAMRVAATAPDVYAAGNPGCLVQVSAALRRAGRPIPALHPIELVDASLQGMSSAQLTEYARK
jgi:hypothetical protein